MSTIRTTSTCPFCSTEGEPHLKECRDLHNGVKGQWDYLRCPNCSSVWMHPLPPVDEIPGFYPKNYDFIRRAGAAPTNTLRDRVKNRLVERVYGYPEAPGSHFPVERAFAAALSYFTAGTTPAGFQVGFAPYIKSGRLLEVGPGNGDFLARMAARGWTVEGLEPDAGAVEFARSRGLRVTRGLLERSAFEPESFDVIFMHHAFEHLYDLEKSVAVVASALKRGGLFISISPNPASGAAEYFGRWWLALDTPRHLHLPTPEGYKRFLAARGFEVRCIASNRTLAPIIAEGIRHAPGLKRLGLRGRLLGRNLVNRNGGEEVIAIARKR